MSKLYLAGVIALAGLLSGALASAQQEQQRPQPSTSETEGTAADATPPGETPTQATPGQAQDPSEAQDPRPSTSETEGTAADRTPPGSTATQGKATPGAAHSELVGAAVVSQSDAPLGKVVDVVFDAKNQPAFVVIATGGKATAVPFEVASAMMSEDKIVMDQSRLLAAPKVRQGEWRSQSSSWKQDATRYWDRG